MIGHFEKNRLKKQKTFLGSFKAFKNENKQTNSYAKFAFSKKLKHEKTRKKYLCFSNERVIYNRAIKSLWSGIDR